MSKLIVTLDLELAREASRDPLPPPTLGDMIAAWLCRAASTVQLEMPWPLDDPLPEKLPHSIHVSGSRPVLCVRIE